MKMIHSRANHGLYKLQAAEDDWADVGESRLAWMYQLLLLIRRFEETLLDLKNQELIHGPVHSSIGQEAVAVGAALALRSTDKIVGTHRAHHQYLAKALCSSAGEDYDALRDGFPPVMIETVRVLLSEIMGLRNGCCGGRGGSMHLFNSEVGVQGTNAIVGGGIPMATGTAWADRKNGRDDITVCFFGDGAVYQGTLHESANLASLWQAPIVYFIENNHYSVGTKAKDACSAREIVDVAVAYGLRGIQVDGMDPLAVMLAIEHIKKATDGEWLPCFVEADTYRFFHHAGGIAGSAYGYRSKDEERTRRQLDPVNSLRQRLRTMGIIGDSEDRMINGAVEDCISRAVAACTRQKGSTVVIPAELWPDVTEMNTGLPSRTTQEGLEYVEAEDLEAETEDTYVEAIAAVTGRWLEQDPRVIVMGEEVANLGGGAYGATKNLSARFPGRVINTPISEAGFSGLACGAAMNGLHPVVEIMFSSFALVAADQLFNQIGQLSQIYGGRVGIPLVARMRVAIGLGYGAQHSLDPAALFRLFPGWRVFAPTSAFDYIGLFNAAMKTETPTVIIEHQQLYNRTFMVPADDLDFLVQPGKAKVIRVGTDVTVVAYSSTVALCAEASNQLRSEGIEAEVLDLRTLDFHGVDYESIGRSIQKTGALVIVEQAPACNSIGPQIAAECVRRFFDYFDGPPAFVSAPNVPIPVSRHLEQSCIPTVTDVCTVIAAAARREIQ